jgi:hypothetical protein
VYRRPLSFLGSSSQGVYAPIGTPTTLLHHVQRAGSPDRITGGVASAVCVTLEQVRRRPPNRPAANGRNVPLPGGAPCGALRLAWNGFELSPVGTEGSAGGFNDVDVRPMPKSLAPDTFGPEWHPLAPNAASPQAAKSEVRPEGFEPPTLGSEDRCAIQLRHGREPSSDRLKGVVRVSVLCHVSSMASPTPAVNWTASRRRTGYAT